MAVPFDTDVTGWARLGPQDVWLSTRQAYHHWNGHQWTSYELPGTASSQPTNLGAHVEAAAISAVAPDDVWAIAAAEPLGHSLPQVAHWDGSHWSMLDVSSAGPYPFGAGQFRLIDIAASSADDVWVVGECPGTAGGFCPVPAAHQGVRIIVEHWDGHGWHDVPPPADLTGTALPHLLMDGPDRPLLSVAAVHPVWIFTGADWQDVSPPATLGRPDPGAPLTPDGSGGFWVQTAQTTVHEDYDGVYAEAGAGAGLLHRTLDGRWTMTPAPRPSLEWLKKQKKSGPPWNDRITVTLTARLPGTGTLWVHVDHFMYPEGLSADDVDGEGTDQSDGGDLWYSLTPS